MPATLSSLLGTRLTLLVGPAVAVPAPITITENLISAEVVEGGGTRDGFQLTFRLSRGPYDLVDSSLVTNPLLRPFNRVILLLTLGPRPDVLIDGVITHRQVTPGDSPCEGRFVVSGEDLRALMDLREEPMAFPQMPPQARVALILLKYQTYLGGPPRLIPPLVPDVPPITESVPAKAGTDLAYVERLAEENGYVFYIETTPVPMINSPYWGPENRLGLPQPALAVDMGFATNVSRMTFHHDAKLPTMVAGMVLESTTHAPVPVVVPAAPRVPLALVPASVFQAPYVKTVQPTGLSRVGPLQTLNQAVGAVGRAADAITAEGELDVDRYGQALRARRLVGVRGAGLSLDGLYYVDRVTHTARQGSYTQTFRLKREGLGTTVPVVSP